MSRQEYLYNSEYVTIAHDVVGDPDLVVVVTDREEYIVANKKNLQKKEDSWGYKRAQERADELRLITQKAEENLDKIVDKVVDKALIALSSRMKFNVLFGDNSNVGWASLVIDELKKLVKEKAPEVVKGDKDPF